ncbi:MAG TPA: glycoside hydrolase family 15 protein [Candidatus Binataceae bacterium]|nr:glycoside hydrolase family 15 protein [Candidatus Binataceae bacterium]
MAIIQDSPRAFGGPGIAPRWTHSAKDVVGTAYSTPSRVWFTASDGVLSEIYYPTIDRPQVRDLQYLVTDGETFFHDAHRQMESHTEYFDDCGLGVRITNSDRDGRYQIVIEVITDPHQPCVLLNTRLEGDPDFLSRLKLFVLLAPHLEVGGWHNNGNFASIAGHEFLTAHKQRVWLSLVGTAPFVKRSCGYVGTTDGWTDLAADFKLDYNFASAPDGNVALIGEIDLRRGYQFTLGLAFGNSLHRAVTTLLQSLGIPYAQHKQRFIEQWQRACHEFLPLGRFTGDNGALYHKSNELLLAHEDKGFPGAIIASMSIPWGEIKGDEDLGGYHLVWTRDMVNSATGLLAAGDVATPLRALIYLACSQRPDGGFPQNFWIDGEPYWRGIQLDEVAFPIMLAWRMARAGALADFDPYPMVRAAAKYLMMEGPVTPQERWEENSGFSPSTLASVIAGLICAAAFARDRDDEAGARFLEDYADFLETHIERWTVTSQGFLVPGIKRHYVRINPADPHNTEPNEDPDQGLVSINNRKPGDQWQFHAAEIVDAGFLELVRYGIRKAGDPLIEDSLKVIDAVLKTDFPGGPCWRRYTHDGYGQRDDGGAFDVWGVGRPWPLLSGERGHYELAAGRDARPYLLALERFAISTRLLPEQIWDLPDLDSELLYYGKPTGSAMPLMWAHAEYIKLVRSVADDHVFDLIPEVVDRFQKDRPRPRLEIWKPNRRVRSIPSGTLLRIQAPNPFVLHWCKGDWANANDSRSIPTSVGIEYVDIDVAAGERAPVNFTFYWPERARWEGRDYAVAIVD